MIVSINNVLDNVLARSQADEGQYEQQFKPTVIAKNKAREYSAERDQNTTSKEDRGIIIQDFRHESVKKWIDTKVNTDTKLTTDEDKAVAACYRLYAPRLLDFQCMILTEDDPLYSIM